MISFNDLKFDAFVGKQKLYNLDYKYFIDQSKKGYSPLNLDFDHKKQIRLGLKKLKKSKYNKGKYKVLWRKSSSRRGIHLTVFYNGKQLFLPINSVLRIRRLYHDCLGRLGVDKLRAKAGLPISILFYFKNRKTATAWRDIGQFKLR